MTTEAAAEMIDTIYVGDTPAEMRNRQLLLNLLRNMPTVVGTMCKFATSEVFRVIMSKENAHLFKQGTDGVFKPFLHNGRNFVENVDLLRVSPDYFAAVSNIALTLNMAAFAVKLDAIEVGVRNTARLMADTQRGKVKGALDALALARALTDPAERRKEMISAGRDVVAELGALTGQLRAHIAAMPNEQTGLLDGIFGSGFAEAKVAYEEVKDDVELLIDGIRSLLRAYQDLEEPVVAREAIARILVGLEQACFSDAIRKARLLPFRGEIHAPELYLGSFLNAVTLMREKLQQIDQPDRPLIAVDFRAEELMD